MTLSRMGNSIYNNGHKRLSVRLRDIICPTFYLKTYSDVYSNIDNYLKHRLSLDNLIKSCEDIEMLKAYAFDRKELYILEHIDRIKSKIFNLKVKQGFNSEVFKEYYKQVMVNEKFMDILD
jgi:hypothetical protein